MSLPDFSRLSLQPAETGVNLVGHAQCDPYKSAWPCMRLKPSLHNWRLAEPLMDAGITMDSCTIMVRVTSGAGWDRDTPYYTVKNSWQWQVFLELVREKLPGYRVSFHLAVTSEAWIQEGRTPALIPNRDPNATWFYLAKYRGFFDGDLHGSRHKDGKFITGFVSFKERRPEVLAALFTAMHEYNQRYLNPLLASPVEPEEEAEPVVPSPTPNEVWHEELEQLMADDVWNLLAHDPEPDPEPDPATDLAPCPDRDRPPGGNATPPCDRPVPEPAPAPAPELPTDDEVREFETRYFGL